MSRVIQLVWLALALACGTALAEGDIRWAPDVATARRAAAQFEVPLLIHFYGDNCLPCKTLEQRVFSQATVVSTLNKYFICVRVNASVERAAAAEYQVHSWPTDVFVSPDGQILYQGVCKQDVAGYMDVLQGVAVSNRDRNVMLAAQRKAQPNPPTEMAATNAANPTGPLTALANHTQPATGSPAQSVPLGNTPQPTANSPAALIQSGPLSASQQPISIASSSAKNQLQIQSPHSGSLSSSPMSGNPMSSNHEGLPPLPGHTNSLGVNGYNSPNRDAFKGQSSMPRVASPATTAQPASQSSSGNGVAAKMVSNPYYKPEEPAYCGPDGKCYTAAGEPIATAPAAMLGQPATHGLPDYPSMAPQPQAVTASTPNLQPSTGVLPPGSPTFQPKSNALVSTTTTAKEPVASNVQGTLGAPAAAESPAIEGYCPIALNTTGNWVPGNKDFAIRHRGRVYWLQNETAAQQFLAAPDRFSPKLSGYDPMIFLEQGKLVEGSLQHGLHDSVSGGVLFFATAESKQAFEKEPERNSRALGYVLQAVQK